MDFNSGGNRPCISNWPNAYFLFIYIANVRIYVERRTKKMPEFQIGIKLSTHSMSFFVLFLMCVVFILPASQTL